MKKTKLLTFLLGLAACLATANLPAQSPALYQIVISGVCWDTNANGAIVSTPLNNRTLLRDVARASGNADYSSWGLAYHFHGSELGDTIDVIDRSTGAVLRTLFGLYFGTEFGRTSILSASHRQQKRLEYIYTSQNSHSLGSVLLTDYFFFDANGHTNKVIVLGQMQWVVTPDADHDRSQVCSATFTTVRPWQFSPGQ